VYCIDLSFLIVTHIKIESTSLLTKAYKLQYFDYQSSSPSNSPINHFYHFKFTLHHQGFLAGQLLIIPWASLHFL